MLAIFGLQVLLVAAGDNSTTTGNTTVLPDTTTGSSIVTAKPIKLYKACDKKFVSKRPLFLRANIENKLL